MILKISELVLLLALVGGLVYAIILLRHIAYQADLLVNTMIPWMNSIGGVVIPNFKDLPIPMWKGP